ncbi:MAG TPA: apolipoprotein N-acyltransferase [Streptosporangiaceae bacterium]|nr:apolipoprotein N-acyltransferase [Streptosporangiaceae bacterium]
MALTSTDGDTGGEAGKTAPGARAPGGPYPPLHPYLSRLGRLSPRLAPLGAVAGGVTLAASFPPVGAWALAPAGPAVLALLLRGRRLRAAFMLGLLFGLAFFLPLLSWLTNLAWYAWVALAVAEALVFAVLGVAQRLLLYLRAWPLAVAAWWVAAEAVRDRWPYAFPWGRLAMSQAGGPAVRWVAVGGPPLLSFLLALTGTTIAWALTSPARHRLLPALAVAATAGLTLAGGLLPVDPQPAAPPTAVVAAVQGDVPHARDLPALLRATTVTANHAAATRHLAVRVSAGAEPAPDLVVWPENSTDLDPRLYPDVFADIASAVAAVDRPVLVGEVLQDPQRNVGQIWTPSQGPGPVYVKRQLVPFGEYIPFRGLLAHVTSLVALQPRDFTAGHRVVVFHVGQIRLGDVICYEVGFDNLVASDVGAGANLLAMQTNDATFEVDGQRGETLQQLGMARVRAVEYDRAVVVASTTGVSAIIAPDGRLLAHSGTWQQAVLEARVPLLTYRTLAARAGAWPEYAAVALTLLALACAITIALRRRQPAPTRDGDQLS